MAAEEFEDGYKVIRHKDNWDAYQIAKNSKEKIVVIDRFGRDRDFFENGRHSRVNGPAEIIFWDNGNLKKEVWRVNGVTTRDGGPAITFYRQDGTKSLERWYRNGLVHNEAGPAEVYYNKDGSIKKVSYNINNHASKPLWEATTTDDVEILKKRLKSKDPRVVEAAQNNPNLPIELLVK